MGGGWYAVTADTAYTNRITVNGDVHLILCDGAKLNAKGGIGVNYNTPNNNKLHIFAGTDKDGEIEGKGVLDAKDSVPNGYAGIGGDINQNCGEITINGGKITVHGGDADGSTMGGAGIGGGAEGNGGKITINGGEVTATGGKRGSGSFGGAGIGGGKDEAGGSITITDGTVIATGDETTAGIGGGFEGAGEEITIEGGNVVAVSYGDSTGAGIGGGYHEPGGTIAIKGGNVITKSSLYGIGDGEDNNTGPTGTLTVDPGMAVYVKDAFRGFDPNEKSGIDEYVPRDASGNVASGNWKQVMWVYNLNVTLDKDKASLKTGETITLSANVIPNDARGLDTAWSSDKEDVATVDEDGTVTAVSAGEANISFTAKGDNVDDSVSVCRITVTDPEKDPSSEKNLTLRELAILAMREGRADIYDTGKIVQSGGKYGTSVSGDVVITVPKKSKFYVTNCKGKVKRLGSKKVIKVYKNGKIHTKRTASLYPISYTDKVSGNEINLKLNIIVPKIVGKKNLKAKVKKGTAFDFATSIPLNAVFKTPKKASLVKDLVYKGEESIGEDGKIHIRGTAVSKGTLKLPFTFNGKKYTVKIKIK